jgi:hypothetical protein
VLFESIRRFKGLERDVIILVELPESGERPDELLLVCAGTDDRLGEPR